MATSVHAIWDGVERAAPPFYAPLSSDKQGLQRLRIRVYETASSPTTGKPRKLHATCPTVGCSIPFRLVISFLTQPEFSAVGGILNSVAYGTKTDPVNDSYINLAEEVTGHLSDSAIPTAVLLDSMPYLLPILTPFLPGNVFKKTRLQWEELVSRFRDDPFCHVQQLRVRFNLFCLIPPVLILARPRWKVALKTPLCYALLKIWASPKKTWLNTQLSKTLRGQCSSVHPSPRFEA